MTTARPLDGIRVLELAQWLPGPYCTSLLRDLGATVVKIEAPSGDIARGAVPGLFASVNGSKRSVIIDLKTADGVRAFLALARHADVILESNRPGTLDKLGIGAAVVRGLNTRIVYCSLSGYGQDGPYRDRHGHDVNYLAVAGASTLDPGPDGLPVVPGFLTADLASGMYAAMGILAALLRRERTGEGDVLDLGMTDALTAWTAPMLSTALAGRLLRLGEFGSYGYFRASDGRVLALGAFEDPQFARLCAALGRGDLAADMRFADTEGRGEHAAALRRELAKIFAGAERDYWVGVLCAAGVAASPVNEPSELLEDPHIAHRGAIRRQGDALIAPFPVRSDRFSAAAPAAPPILGEGGADIARAWGCTDKEVAQVRRGIGGAALRTEREPQKVERR